MDMDAHQLHTDQTSEAVNIEASGDMATGSDCMAENTEISGLLGPLTSKVDFKLSSLKDAMAEYSELKHVLDGVVKEKERLQHEKEMLQLEKEMLQHQHKAHGEALAAMKEDILASKCTLTEARDALVALTDENSHLKSKNNQAEQQCGSATEPIQPRGAQAGQKEKQKRLSERRLGIDPSNLEAMKEYPRQELVNNPPVGQTSCFLVSEEDDIEEVRDEVIKRTFWLRTLELYVVGFDVTCKLVFLGLLEIDTGRRRRIGIKEMGKLNEKAFKAACLAKLPPEEQQLGDLSWYPSKTVTFGGNQRDNGPCGACINYQELLNTGDEKLQELERAWGSGARDAVVEALFEMKECGRLSDRSITYELWNYKEGKRATMRECVNYMSDQVKRFTRAKRREIHRLISKNCKTLISKFFYDELGCFMGTSTNKGGTPDGRRPEWRTGALEVVWSAGGWSLEQRRAPEEVVRSSEQGRRSGAVEVVRSGAAEQPSSRGTGAAERGKPEAPADLS
ncbi:hypothetical protein U9M48_037145 [Paspalum notatum var. saurae]|uniref:Factor of DNA methylation 1-5/IDN2 domain-containing protein n=1 Tax=Paspalum notatum var. saurae TaxID=547442 RepID=A0AAQ3UII8_PASNO